MGDPDADLSGCDRDELREWFMDADGDGFGDPGTTMLQCGQPDGFVENSEDCDDTTAEAKPGGTELLCDGLDNDCDTNTPEQCATGCDPFRSSEGIYALCVVATTHAVAKSACESMDMDLAQIDSSAENTVLRSEMTTRMGGAQFFVGGQDLVEHVWRWPDGTQFWVGAAGGMAVNGQFATWTAGEPNNANGNEDCMEVFGDGRWNDVPCTDVRAFACERASATP